MEKRFENAQVGDLVYDRIWGDGYIHTILDDDPEHHFYVFYPPGSGYYYKADGRQFEDQAEPTLFYRLGACRYLTTRPANGSKQAFRECRECLGLDRVAMASALGVSRHTVRNWETEKHPNTPPDWVWKSIERMTP